MFVSNFRRCHLPLKLTGSVPFVPKSCKLCPLDQIQLDFFVKSGHPNGILVFLPCLFSNIKKIKQNNFKFFYYFKLYIYI
ncbi:hypothetical protein Hanom_Chr08g00757201 [Helianthus anomalus]